MNEQLKRFANDRAMNSSVYESLRSHFLKRRKIEDVQMLATERLALFLLEDAWKEILRHSEAEKEKEEVGNPGL